MVPTDFTAGDIVIRQGDTEDDRFYVVASGEFSVVAASMAGAAASDASEAPLHVYKCGGSFGELALRYGNARKATIRCDARGLPDAHNGFDAAACTTRRCCDVCVYLLGRHRG